MNRDDIERDKEEFEVEIGNIDKTMLKVLGLLAVVSIVAVLYLVWR